MDQLFALPGHLGEGLDLFSQIRPHGAFSGLLRWIFSLDVGFQFFSNHEVSGNHGDQACDKNRVVFVHHPVAHSQDAEDTNAED